MTMNNTITKTKSVNYDPDQHSQYEYLTTNIIIISSSRRNDSR